MINTQGKATRGKVALFGSQLEGAVYQGGKHRGSLVAGK